MSREDSLGITHYVGSGPSLQGIIKKRYSDFRVNEIDPNGKVTHITENTSFTKNEVVDDDELSFETVSNGFVSILKDEDKMKEIWDLYETQKGEVLIDESDKDARSSIHSTIRAVFKSKLLSETSDGRIRVFPARQFNSGRNTPLGKRKYDQRNFKAANPDVADYVQIHLRKENMDTVDAAQYLAKLLRINPKSISFAGTKDRRAVTTQRMVIRNLAPSRLAGIANMHHSKIEISDIKITDKPAQLGDLNGNEFVIVVRELKLINDSNTISKAFTMFSETGRFVNYFGKQRFGTQSICTSKVGLSIICEKWKETVQLLLDPRENDLPSIDASRTAWKEGKIEDALKMMPHNCIAEKQVLLHLASSPNDFKGAVQSINRDLRLLYLHSFQSLIWNISVSKRIAIHGLTVLLGDLYYADDNDSIRTVDADTINSIAIDKVVIPIVGCNSIIPSSMKQIIHETIQEVSHGEFDLDSFMKGSHELSGNYRTVVASVQCFDWAFSSSSDNNIDFSEGHKTMMDGDATLGVKFQLGSSSYATMALRELIEIID